MLGDVGGLLDAFKLIGETIVAFTAGNSLNNYIASQLFFFASKKERAFLSDTQAVSSAWFHEVQDFTGNHT